MPVNVANTKSGINVANTMKLVKALESGKYKKCKEQLRKGNRFCCLGVATDLFIKAHPGEMAWGFGCLEADGNLPYQVQTWLGWETADGSDISAIKTKTGPVHVGLDALNDGHDSSNIRARGFRSIAKIIRAKLASLKKKPKRQ